MTKQIPPQHLRHLRNDIPINDVIQHYLDIPTKFREGFLRFLCPVCAEFNTATNPATNLARCFTCSRNFNPIDIVMVVRKCSFLAAVEFIQNYQHNQSEQQKVIAQLIDRLARLP